MCFCLYNLLNQAVCQMNFEKKKVKKKSKKKIQNKRDMSKFEIDKRLVYKIDENVEMNKYKSLHDECNRII